MITYESNLNIVSQYSAELRVQSFRDFPVTGRRKKLSAKAQSRHRPRSASRLPANNMRFQEYKAPDVKVITVEPHKLICQSPNDPMEERDNGQYGDWSIG